MDVTGIDNHELNALRIVDAAARITTQRGPAIVILRQYAYHGLGRTIHSAGQIEHYRNKVDDRSMLVGGRQCIRTNDGFIIPLDIINGLPYMKMHPHTDKEWEDLPHVVLTGSDTWNPTHLDNILTDKEDWYNTLKDLDDGLIQTPFDEFGNYRHRTPDQPVTVIPDPATPEPATLPTATPATPIDSEPVLIEAAFAEFRDAFHSVSDLNIRYVCMDSETTTNPDDPSEPTVERTGPKEVKKKPVDYERYRPYFLHTSTEKVRRTFQRTTQYATNIMSGRIIMQTLKSPYPANNVWRRNEPVASDTIFAAVAAVFCGHTMAQIYVGCRSLVIDVFGMSTEKQFINTLEDQIRKRGAMDKLITDSAKVEISERVKEVARALLINMWQSEAHYQQQNPAERRWKHYKHNIQWFMNWRNVDANAWLLCAEWVADVMNHTSEKSLGWRPPLEVLTGQTIDISILLIFLFWDVVYCTRYDDTQYRGQVGSEKSSEIRGRFVGFSWDVGHALTFKILTDDTKRVIRRSRVRLAKDGENNLKLDTEAGAVPERVYIHSKRGDDEHLPVIDLTTNPISVEHPGQPHPPSKKGEQTNATVTTEQGERQSTTKPSEQDEEYHSPMDDPPLAEFPIVETLDEDEHAENDDRPSLPGASDDITKKFIHSYKTDNPTESAQLPPEELLDRTFLMPPKEDGSRVRAKIIEKVRLHKEELAKHPDMVKFKCLVNDDYEEVVAYNDIVDFIEQDQTWDGIWKFRAILDHQGPLRSTDSRYKGSRYNVQVEWETGEITWEPLSTKDKNGVFDTDPVTIAIYARERNLLDTPGWKLPGLKKYAKTQQRMLRLANQAKLHSFRTKPIFMYGFQVPRNHDQAMEIDRQNGNTKWLDSERIELAQIDEYEAFKDMGTDWKPEPGYKKITAHLVYAVKHDGRHKSRLVAGGHLTETPVDSVYSSVVSLRGIRILAFLAELNNLELWATDIGNAYLESYTNEKVYIRAGAEFGDREGHYLVIVKALYGLKSSGVRWHERFADVLRKHGFFPSKAERDIWMRNKGDHYEYIAVYVDDLLIASNDPKAITDTLMNAEKFKLKGTGPVTFHLGCDFFREDGVLCYAPKKYIEKLLNNYERIFGSKPKQAVSPLVKGDHPELDTTELLDIDEIKIYQSLIGGLQWVIQIGRFDIQTAVMTMSRFRAAPRRGHLERVKRIHGYLSKMCHGINRIRTEMPDFSDLPEKKYDWAYSCYSDAKEDIPTDAPPPRGKSVQPSHYYDANLYHCMISGKSVTGVLHLLNKTAVDWFSKLQSTVETATFGSEYVAARTCTEQIIDIRTTLRYLGVPIEGPSYVFGDNETVVNTASVPHSRLQKRHNALSYHRVRAAIAAGFIRMYHIAGATNPADILSKHWDYPSVWSQLKPLLFWRGDTAKLLKSEETSKTESKS